MTEEIYCWVCGGDDDSRLVGFDTCIKVVRGNYICKECCEDCFCDDGPWLQEMP